MNTVRSVDRAIDVIGAVSGRGVPMTLGEVTRALGAPKSTTLNIVRTLVRRRVLEFDARTKTYRPGYLLPALAGFGGAPSLATMVRPHLERLGLATGEVVQIGVLDGHEIRVLDTVESPQPVRYVAPVGARRPLHSTAAGKLTLALLPPPRAEACLAEAPLRRYTPATITDPRRLRAELAAVRARGWALSEGEFVADLTAVAVPLRRGRGGPFVASLVVAGPTFRVRQRVRQILARARRAARVISAELGDVRGDAVTATT